VPVLLFAEKKLFVEHLQSGVLFREQKHAYKTEECLSKTLIHFPHTSSNLSYRENHQDVHKEFSFLEFHCSAYIYYTHDWYENFRMRKVTFDYLCMKLKPTIERKTTRLRDAISVEQQVAICVWCLATSVKYRTAAHLFGVSRSSVCLTVDSVCLAIVELLMPTCIQLLRSSEELSEIFEMI